jgi:thiol-disulfide isomerase/thioredoxin
MRSGLLSLFVLLYLISNAQTLTTHEIDSINNEFSNARNKRNKDAIGKPYPSFSFATDGKVFNNDLLKGKTVFINFWFEACAPCIAEFGALSEVYQKLKDNKNFEFISFTFETPEKIKKVKEKYPLPYTVISIDRKECYRLNLNNGFPANMILDSTGAIKYMSFGGNTDKAIASKYAMENIYPEIVKLL